MFPRYNKINQFVKCCFRFRMIIEIIENIPTTASS